MGAAKVDKLSGEDSGSFNFENVQLASAVQMVLPLTWSFHCSKFGKLYPRDRKTDDRADLKADDQTHTFGIDFIGFQVGLVLKLSIRAIQRNIKNSIFPVRFKHSGRKK